MPNKHTYDAVKAIIEKNGFTMLSTSYKDKLTPIKIKCNKCKRECEQRFMSFMQGSRCRYCSGTLRGVANRQSKDEIIKKMEDRHHKLLHYYYVEDVKRLTFVCVECNTMVDCTYKTYCTTIFCCEKSNDTSYNYVNELVEKNGDKLTSYDDIGLKKAKMIVCCGKCKINYKTSLYNYSNGSRCANCNCHKKKNIDDIRKTINEGGDTLISDGHNGHYDKLDILCGKCKNVYKMTCYDYEIGRRCRDCMYKENGEAMKYTQEFVESYIKKAGDVLVDKYIDGCTKIKIMCGICCKEYSTKFYNYKNKSSRCRCNSKKSIGEQLIKKYLMINAIDFEEEKTFDGCFNKAPLRFDFYLKKYNLLIEFDGALHFESISYFGGDDAFERRKVNDTIKNIYCIKNKKNLFRISYDQMKNIESLLTSYLETDTHSIIEYTSIDMYKELIDRTEI